MPSIPYPPALDFSLSISSRSRIYREIPFFHVDYFADNLEFGFNSSNALICGDLDQYHSFSHDLAQAGFEIYMIVRSICLIGW